MAILAQKLQSHSINLLKNDQVCYSGTFFWYQLVLGFLLLWQNTITNVGGRVYSAYAFTSLFIIKESQNRNSRKEGSWRQMLLQRSWRGTDNDLLINLLFYRTQNQWPRQSITHDELGTPPPIIKEHVYRLAYSLILWYHFLNQCFLISNALSLCQVDIAKQHTKWS